MTPNLNWSIRSQLLQIWIINWHCQLNLLSFVMSWTIEAFLVYLFLLIKKKCLIYLHLWFMKLTWWGLLKRRGHNKMEMGLRWTQYAGFSKSVSRICDEFLCEIYFEYKPFTKLTNSQLNFPPTHDTTKM